MVRFYCENTFPPLEIDFGITDITSEELESCLDDQYERSKDRILEDIFSFFERSKLSISTNQCVSLEDSRFNNIYTKAKRVIKEDLRIEKTKNS